MIVEIADIVKGYLEPYRIGSTGTNQFIDKLAGLVKTVTKTDVNSNNVAIKKTFPVSCNVAFDDCVKKGLYTDLIPNSKLGCIVYLEDNFGLRLLGRNGIKYKFNASYRIVGWINSNKLGKTDCSITSKIILALINKFPTTPKLVGNYQSILIEVLGQDPKSYNPFSKYSFDEDKTQYLMHPYDFFSLPIEVTFELNPACAEEFLKEAQINCNTN